MGELTTRVGRRRKKRSVWIAFIFFLTTIAGGLFVYDRAVSKEKITVTAQLVTALPANVPKYSFDEQTMKEMLTPVPEQLIIINRATNQLALFVNGQLVKVFPVATGKRSTPTPEGIFPISNKIKNRPYYKENIPGGDPSNPLGDRWIGLDVNGTKGTTYAIHGNNNPSSIGKYISGGCIRMYDKDAQYLFEQVKVGTVVIIKSFDEPWNVLALEYGYKIYA